MAAVTPYCWIRSGEANSIFVDSSGNNRNFNLAFSSGNEGNPGIVLVPMATGGPLGGTSGPVSSVAALWGSTNRAASAMWQDPWTFPATNYVLEAWILPVGTGGTANNPNGQFASTGDGTGLAFRTRYEAGDDTITLRLDTFMPGTTTTVGMPVIVDRTRWTHVAAVNDNGMVTFYVNGVASGAPSAFAMASGGSAFVGGGSGTYNPFHGYLDEVRYSTFAAGAFAVGDLLTRPPGPGYLTQPAAASVWDGGAAPFEVRVAYDESTTYQWKLGGTAVEGATGPEFTLPAVTPANTGAVYSVDVASDGVTVPSAAATLTVVPNKTEDTNFYRAAVQAEASLVAFFPVDGDTGLTATNLKNAALHGTLDGNVSYDGRTDRSLGQRALRFKSRGLLTVPPHPGLELTGVKGTVEAIVYLEPTVSSGQATIFSVAEPGALYYELRAGLDGGSLSYDDDMLAQPINWSVPVSLKGRFAHVAFVFGSETVTAYVDGESLGSKPLTSLGFTTGLTANIGSSGPDGNGGVVTPWLGTIDELAVYSEPLPPATLAVHNSRFKFGTAVSPPVITGQPSGTLNLTAGGAPAFRVVSTGTAPLSYQWQRNGVNVTDNPTATTSALVLNHSTVAMSGTYTVTVTNPQGSDTSDPFTVNFTAPADTYSGYVLADNPSAYWRLDETSGTVMKDHAGGLDGTYATTVSLGEEGGPGMTPGKAVKFPGGGTPVGNAVVPFSPTLNPNGAFSIEFWARPSVSGQNSLAVLAAQNRNTGRAGYAAYQGLNGSFWEVHLGTGETVMNIAGGPSPAAGRWDHVVATWDGGATATLYVNGEQVSQITNGGPLRPNLQVPLEIGSRFNGGIPYNGTVDEVALYGHALTQEQVRKHFSIAWVPAVITQEPPAAVTATEAGTLTLTAAASGYPNTYQWLLNGEPIDPAAAAAGHYPQGVTSPTLVIEGIGPADAGSYTLRVINPLGEQTTAAAVVTYAADTTPPVLTEVTADASRRRVRVSFNRPMDAESAGLAANYVFSGGLTVSSVVATMDPSVFNVVTSPQIPGVVYSLVVSNVKDQRNVPNVIGPNRNSFGAAVHTPGVLALDFYAGIGGQSVDNLRNDPQFPDGVLKSKSLTAFSTRPLTNGDLAGNPEFGAVLGNNYGVRIYGWITPEVTGAYRFFTLSDDASELWLSSGSSPEDVALIAFQNNWTAAFMEPAETITQTSAPVTLTAGKSYFVEMFQKEGAGGDEAQVAWRMEGDPTAAAALTPIPSRFLSAPAIPPGPVSPLVPEIRTPVFEEGTILVSWTGPGKLQESTDLRNWTDVPGNPVTPHVAPALAHKFYRVLNE